jgi:two-component sensor histidine kinase
MSAWSEAAAAMDEARARVNSFDRFAQQMAEMLAGRLRKIDSTRLLRTLKRELRDFDSVTGKWKS